MLARHPRAVAGGELRLLSTLVRGFVAEHGLMSATASLDSVPTEAFAALGHNYMRETRRIAAAPAVIIDTMPPNFRLIGFVRLALPNARIIHCVRDPLEHCVAMFQKNFARGGHDYAWDLGELAAYRNLYGGLMAHWHSLFPGFICDVDVADISRDPEPALRRILDFCGLRWNPVCLAPYDPEPELGASVRQSLGNRRERLQPYASLLRPLLNEGREK
jgi:hypothetical protein